MALWGILCLGRNNDWWGLGNGCAVMWQILQKEIYSDSSWICCLDSGKGTHWRWDGKILVTRKKRIEVRDMLERVSRWRTGFLFNKATLDDSIPWEEFDLQEWGEGKIWERLPKVECGRWVMSYLNSEPDRHTVCQTQWLWHCCSSPQIWRHMGETK